jgi:FkbM family methyltransferase
MAEKPWIPPSSLEERVRRAVVPAGVRLDYLVDRELRRGERELALLPFLAPRGKVALDIGANKGVWAAMLRRLGCDVHAFEPNPKIYRELERALKGKAHLHALALSDESGEADFLIPKYRRGYSNQHGTLSRVRVDGEHGVVRVATRRLDDLGLEGVGFMKIDVEGFESAVIRGAARTIERDRPNLVVELEERHTKRPIEALIGEVTALGYDGYALVDGALTRWERVDLQRRHREPATRADYIFNFIFLPRP